MRKFLLITFMMLGLTVSLYAQERTVTGKVTDSKDSSPLPGVSVGIKGTSSGAITDIDGKYSITVPSDETILVFTFVGYTQQEITVGVMSIVDVQLASDVKVLKDVVITANAIGKEKRSLGYATSTLKSEDLVKTTERSLLNSMQGKVAGVFIQSNPGVGSSTRVVIRGGTSITGNNQPLFVVDGIPIDNSSFSAGPGTGISSADKLNNQVDPGNRANDINPEDIESVTILKGPAAAALYGTRASNGAVLITTKSGKGGAKNKKMEVTYATSFTQESVLRLPEFQNDFGQGYGAHDTQENTSWGPAFDGSIQNYGNEVDGEQRTREYKALPNNVRDFFQNGHTYTNNVSLGGGNQQSNYYVSFGDVNQKGVMPNTKFRRTSFKISGGTELSNKISASSSINYVKSQGDLSMQGQGYSSPYFQVLNTPRNVDLLELKDLNNKFNTPDGYYSPFSTNPWYKIYKSFYKTNTDRVIGNVQLNYKPLDWFSVTYRLGGDIYTDGRRQGRDIYQPSATSANAAYGALDPGFYREATYTVSDINSDLMLNFKKDFSENFGFTALVGQNVRQLRTGRVIGTINELVIPGLYTLTNANTLPITTNFNSVKRLMGVYADINFSFKKYLFFGFTGRNDWSSTLPKGGNSFFYPSVNASFVFTDAFNIQSKILTYGKIRANLAQVGNDTDPYQLATYFTPGVVDDGYNNSQVRFPFNNILGYSLDNTLGNVNLKPEITQSFEVGADFYLLNERVRIEGSYYNNLSKNQIISVNNPYASGYAFKNINAGALQNKGVELLLQITPIKLANSFEWNIILNYTQNQSLVKELIDGTNRISLGGLGTAGLYAEKGKPYGAMYASTELRDPEGRIVVNPDTGVPIIDSEQRFMGTIQPKYIAGLGTSMSYKGINFNILFDTRQGGIIYSNTKSTVEFAGTSSITTYNNREPFVIPNSVYQDGSGAYIENTTPIAEVPNYWTGNARAESNNILDASYIKLREISLSYTLSSKLLNKTPFGTIQIGVSGRNLFLWTPTRKKGDLFSRGNNEIDPEMNSFGNGNEQGYEFGAIPSTRSYGVNLRVTF